MILIIFATLVGILILFLFLAYYYDKNNNSDNGLIFVRMTVWLLLFVIFVSFMTNGLNYKSGTTSLQTGNETISTQEDYVYSNYTNHTIALFLCIMSALGFISCFFDLRGGFGQ